MTGRLVIVKQLRAGGFVGIQALATHLVSVRIRQLATRGAACDQGRSS